MCPGNVLATPPTPTTPPPPPLVSFYFRLFCLLLLLLLLLRECWNILFNFISFFHSTLHVATHPFTTHFRRLCVCVYVCALVGMHKFLRLLLSYQIIYLRREASLFPISPFPHLRPLPPLFLSTALTLLVLFACCRKISICVPPTSMVDGRSFTIFRYLQALCPFSFAPALICRRHSCPSQRQVGDMRVYLECCANVFVRPHFRFWPFEYEFISMRLGHAAYTQFI